MKSQGDSRKPFFEKLPKKYLHLQYRYVTMIPLISYIIIIMKRKFIMHEIFQPCADTNEKRGVIFDLDGTLWDASSVTEKTWVEVLARHPEVRPAIPLTGENVKLYMGLTNEELAGIFFPDLPFDEAFGLMNESCGLENEWLPVCGGKLYPGLEEALDTLTAEGYGLYIVSNCQDGYIEAFLDAHGMRSRFSDHECSGRSGRPKGENIIDIIKRNGLDRAVYVGDTVSDSGGARTAGIPFIYAKYGFGENYGRGKTGDYDAAIESLSELSDAVGAVPASDKEG